MKNIPVTKPYLPSRERLERYIDGIYEREWLTNNGTLVQELTRRLEDYLGVENLLLVSNGTLALQIAYRALDISTTEDYETSEAITSPFSFIATASSLKWEGIKPVFADIDPDTWCLDPKKAEQAITPNTKAIVPVHVFGNACDVEMLGQVAKKHNLKIIYDAAHAFGIKYKNTSILKHGDAATLSFHATKIFHTAEGGAIIFKEKSTFEKAKKLINFGITGPTSIESLGINAKMNEFQAAIGLSVLDDIERIIEKRLDIYKQYINSLNDKVTQPVWNESATKNGGYFPILFNSEEKVLLTQKKLDDMGICSRRYFFPSLDTISSLTNEGKPQPISKSISRRILCLPIYHDLTKNKALEIIKIINDFS
ncbi:DegT/DnrJ/EryC1/StrS family aminotransferase [Idiomarina aquatica]|uniref:Aminotransferase DegT n=1 Tax=Idiomarina aquatica TaxID=1327752 RepID=A0AA94EGR3_9GAMM|nr:DegT/DnrJ/EryC1/StrS family aminotransferase [Idiomarina aquatica]RUO45054.1 aminotransferase DegT [Idiomarina aquatica]